MRRLEAIFDHQDPIIKALVFLESTCLSESGSIHVHFSRFLPDENMVLFGAKILIKLLE